MTTTRDTIAATAKAEPSRESRFDAPPPWELMYKALLAQLMNYVDDTVARTLSAYGVGAPAVAAAQAAPVSAARTSRSAAARAGSPEANLDDSRSRAPFESVAVPPWLQPFTLPEMVRFTRTPDSLLREERAPPPEPPAPEPVETLADASPAYDEVPSWRKPFTLPPNVRINRTPTPRKPEDLPAPRRAAGSESVASDHDLDEDLSASDLPWNAGQAFDDDAGALPETDDEDELHEAAAKEEPQPSAPSWFHMLRPTREPLLRKVEEQDNSTPVRPAVPGAPGRLAVEVPDYLPHDPDASGWLPPEPDAEPAHPAASEAAVRPVPTGIASPQDARAFTGPTRRPAKPAPAASNRDLALHEGTSRAVMANATWEDLPLDLLVEVPPPTGTVLSREELEQNARLLEGVLEDFGIRGEIINVRPGPVVTLYELEPAPGVKSSRVIGLSDDIARSMSAVSARVAVVQGRNVIGIELPNLYRETVFLRELVGDPEFENSKHKLAIALGKTIGGEPIMVDLARMPHLLVAGTTGSGKSVAINTMILSLLYRLRPEECRLIMIDPKMLELSIYEGIPHLLTPVVTDPKKAVVALKWAVREMEDRYKKMSKVGVRNIDGFNARVTEAAARGEVITRTVQTGYNRETGEPIFEHEELDFETLPYIVLIVDEMADLMMVAGKDIEGAIQRLAQMARAAGIHLIMATQRPSVDVITGTIKANFPTRISFQVTSKIDSRTILGDQGAEQLLGQGDMLYMAGGGRISRVHGPFVSDGEVEKVVAHLKAQGHPAYLDVVVAEEENPDAKVEAPAPEDKPVFERGAFGDDDAALYDQAVKVVLRDKRCSTSYIQRRLQVGYNKAASLVERMEKEGLVGQANNAGKREILVYSRDLRFTEPRDEEE